METDIHMHADVHSLSAPTELCTNRERLNVWVHSLELYTPNRLTLSGSHLNDKNTHGLRSVGLSEGNTCK